LTSLTQVARLRPGCSVQFFSSSGATSCDQRLRSRPSGVKLPDGDRSMTRSRVFTVRPRSDRYREIESRDDNVSVHSPTQSRKETEFFGLVCRLLRARISFASARCRDAVLVCAARTVQSPGCERFAAAT